MLSVAPFGTSLDPALPEAKAFLRIDGSDDDPALARMIEAAAGLAEEFTGQLLVARAVVETVAAATAWHRLLARPVASIEAVAAGDPPAALDAAGYGIDIDASGDGWVRVPGLGCRATASVSYQAGLAPDWASLPAPIRQGVLRLVAHLYTSRDRADDAGPPAAVAALWRPYRRMRLA